MLRTLAASVFVFVLGLGFMQASEWAMAKCPDHLDLPPEHREVSAAVRFQHNFANDSAVAAVICFFLGMAGTGAAAIGGAWRAPLPELPLLAARLAAAAKIRGESPGDRSPPNARRAARAEYLRSREPG